MVLAFAGDSTIIRFFIQYLLLYRDLIFGIVAQKSKKGLKGQRDILDFTGYIIDVTGSEFNRF
jgi:hypothetical protein